jgi:actin-related protein
MCQVAYDYNQELAGKDDRDEEHKSYELPDGKVIQLSKQTIFRPAEAMFNPKLAGSDAMSITDMMRDSLDRCDPELASEMKKNIVLCGGTSILRGLEQRLEK